MQIFCVYEMFVHYIAFHFCKFWEKLFLIIFQDQFHHFIIVSFFNREKITLRECCDHFNTISPNATVDKISFKKSGTYNRLLAKSPFPSPFSSLRRINLKIQKMNCSAKTWSHGHCFNVQWKCRLQDTMCSSNKLYPEPDLSA